MTAQTAAKEKRRISWGSIFVNVVLVLIVIGWSIPTFGLLVSSFRSRFDIQTSGWWTIFPHQEWVTVAEFQPGPELDRNGVMTFEGVSGTFEELREGIKSGDVQVIWIGNRRIGRVVVQEQQWTRGNHDFTLENYQTVLGGKTFQIKQPDGSTLTVQGDNFVNAFLNSLIVSIPATLIPILIAAFAAYGFAWMKFPGRKVMFIMVVALLVVPLQIALVPILRLYVGLDLNGTFLGIWLAHTGFGLPLATYLLFNYISTLPREILESAFIDGASHFTIFMRLVLPLSVPGIFGGTMLTFALCMSAFVTPLWFTFITIVLICWVTKRRQNERHSKRLMTP